MGVLIGTGLSSVKLKITAFGAKPVYLSQLSTEDVVNMLHQCLIGPLKARSLDESAAEETCSAILGSPGLIAQIQLSMGLPGVVEWIRTALTSDDVLSMMLNPPMSEVHAR